MMKIRFLADSMHFEHDGKRYCILYRYTAPDGRTFLTYAEDTEEETELLYALMAEQDGEVILHSLRAEQDWALCDALYEAVTEAIEAAPDGQSDRVIAEAVAAFVPPEELVLSDERRAVVRALMLREGRTPEQWLLDLLFGADPESRDGDADPSGN